MFFFISGAIEKCLGASLLSGGGASAREDERRRAAGEDEEAPEGSGATAQAHLEPRGPPRLRVVTLLLLILTPSLG